MIISIGTDIIEIKRFDGVSQNFIKKIFTPIEIDYYNLKKKSETLAGMFAAKEAVAKCLGHGFNFFCMHDIEIFHDKKNAPFIKLHNDALKISYQLNIKDIKISISHEKKYAIAFAIAQTF